MKKIKVLMALSVFAPFSIKAADTVEFTQMSFNEGAYLGATYMADAPFAAINGNDWWNDNRECTIYILSADLTPVRTFTITIPDGFNISYLESANTSSEYYIQQIRATQYLFNDDDLYEVIVESEEQGDLGFRQYKIYNELGEFLGDCWSHSLVEVNGVPYLYDEYYNAGNDYNSSCLYAINKAGSNVKMIKNDPSNLNVYPNPALNDSSITIESGEFNVAGNILSIFDMKGTLLFKYVYDGGEASVSVPAYKLNFGVNPVVIINESGEVVTSSKIIKK